MLMTSSLSYCVH